MTNFRLGTLASRPADAALADLLEEPLVEAAREQPFDAVAAPDDAARALQGRAEVAEERLRALEIGAADVELAEALVPGEQAGMGRAVEGDVEELDGGQVREERQIGDRERAAEKLAVERRVESVRSRSA